MKKLFKSIVLCFMVIVFLSGAYLVGSGYLLYKTSISKVSIEEKVEGLRSSEDYVELKDISKDFLNGIVAVEDHRFYKHGGIDYISLGRAVVSNLKAGEIVMGGSTISQQLAKNLFFTNEQKFERKIAELFVVNRLEAKYSKEEILELYVNEIYYGDGNWGIKNASEGYFGKSPKEIDFEEAVLLAGLPQAPDYYALSKNYEGAEARSQIVISAMIKNDYISRDLVEEVYEESLYRFVEQ